VTGDAPSRCFEKNDFNQRVILLKLNSKEDKEAFS